MTFLSSPGVTFYSLQKGIHSVELAKVNDCSIHDWSDRLGDFADAAAASAQLALVISVHAAVAHLADAMAEPVWVLRMYVPHWRWLMPRRDSLWYPMAQLSASYVLMIGQAFVLRLLKHSMLW